MASPAANIENGEKLPMNMRDFIIAIKNVRLFVRMIDAQWKICSSVEHRDVAPVRELSHFGKLYCKKRRDANSAISNAIYA